MNKERLKNSLHDFVFCMGILACVGLILFITGQVGCIFSWTGSQIIGTANYAYDGAIDAKGNYTKGKR